MAASNNSLFTFSFKLSIFILLLGVIIFGALIPYAPDIDTDKRFVFEINRLKKENNNQFDIAFFGNSYVYTAYDPTIIKNELGLRAIHVNSASQVLETSLIIANRVIKENNFKYVVLDVSDNSLLRPPKTKEKSWYFQTLALQEIPFSFHKLCAINNYFPKWTYNEYYLASVSKKLGRLFRLNKFGEYSIGSKEPEYHHFSGALFSEDGYFAYDYRKRALADSIFLKEFKKPPLSKKGINVLWNEDLKKLMIQFIERAKSKKTEVILINSLKLRAQDFNKTFIDNLIKRYDNIKFLNLNENRKNYTLDNRAFFNASHLTFLGSNQVTHRFVDSLSAWYKIEKKSNDPYHFKYFNLIDYSFNLTEGEDKFIKLEFDSIPSFLKNYQLVLNFYPKDSTLLSDHSKEKHLKADNIYIKLDKDSRIDTGKSNILIERFKTKITESTLKKIKIFFYKPKDTLRMPSYNLYK